MSGRGSSSSKGELSTAVEAFCRDLSGFARTFDSIVALRRELDHRPHAEG
jgi:hypothetical protein